MEDIMTSLILSVFSVVLDNRIVEEGQSSKWGRGAFEL